jgi:valyl-tRNA synthetase
LLVKEEEYRPALDFHSEAAPWWSQNLHAMVCKNERAGRQALTAVTSGEVKIHPEERFLATYKYWLENVKDWCISRQLWWGQEYPPGMTKAGIYLWAKRKQTF